MADFSNKELPFVKRHPVITAAATIGLLASTAFQVLNRNDQVIFQVNEDGSIIASTGIASSGTTVLEGRVNFSGSSLTDSSYNKFPTDLTGAQLTFNQLSRPFLRSNSRGAYDDFTIKYQYNSAVTGGAGISGAAYVPEVDLLFMVDNNAVNVSIYRASCVAAGCVEFGNITFAGFTDPEALEYLWTIYDANGAPDKAAFAVSREDTNAIILFEWDLQATSGTITQADWTVLAPTNMWTPSGTLGMESLTYIPDRNNSGSRGAIFSCDQTGNECRIIPLNGSLTPAAIEPFDAAAVWPTAVQAVNDLTYDRNTGLILAIGDVTAASTTDQDIWAFDPYTGVIDQYLNNWPSRVLGADGTGANWPQSEGIAISPDGESLWITSETNEVALLKRETKLSGSGMIVFNSSGGGVFNDPGAPVDYRFEGDTDANLLFLDGSLSFIGIGTITPRTKLSIVGTASGSVIRADNTLSSSGTLVWEGAGSGRTLQVGVSLLDGNGVDVNGNMSGRTIFLNGMPAGQALCKKTTGDIGQCTSVVGAGGGCTCN